MTASAPANGKAAGPSVNGIPGQHKHAAKPERAVKPERAARLKAAARVESAEPEPATKDGIGVKLQTAGDVPPRHKPAAPGHVRTPAQGREEPPEGSPREKSHGRLFAQIRLVIMAIVLIAAGSLITLVGLHIANSSSGNSGAGAALQRQEASTRRQAVSWVTQQVSPDDVVSCDQTMCAALRAAGFPGKLLVLGTASQPPVTSAVVVVTQVVRDLFGSNISSAWAPDVLASMGSGAAEVTIRVVAPHGVLAYRDQLQAGMAGRQGYGKVLLTTSRIQLSLTAKQQLTSGQVDPRLVVATAALAVTEPIDILEFGNVGPGASAAIPLRYADLAMTDSAAGLPSTPYLQAMRTRLGQLNLQYRPASSQTVTLPNGHVFRVAFTAPSPLGSISGTP